MNFNLKKWIMGFLPLMFDLPVISLMLRYEIIIKPSFVLSKFWEHPWSNWITCSANGTPQTQLQTAKQRTNTDCVWKLSEQAGLDLPERTYVLWQFVPWLSSLKYSADEYSADFSWRNHVLIHTQRCTSAENRFTNPLCFDGNLHRADPCTGALAMCATDD